MARSLSFYDGNIHSYVPFARVFRCVVWLMYQSCLLIQMLHWIRQAPHERNFKEGFESWDAIEMGNRLFLWSGSYRKDIRYATYSNIGYGKLQFAMSIAIQDSKQSGERRIPLCWGMQKRKYCNKWDRLATLTSSLSIKKMIKLCKAICMYELNVSDEYEQVLIGEKLRKKWPQNIAICVAQTLRSCNMQQMAGQARTAC